jgi:hypothetical protein
MTKSRDGQRDGKGKFVKGHRNIGGRKRGGKDILSGIFLADLTQVWKKGGVKALEKALEENPLGVAKIVAALIPRELLVQHQSLNVDVKLDPAFMLERNKLAAYRLARDFIGAAPLIEAQPSEYQDEDADEHA